MSSLPSITIYTDGGCNPNPGPGAWAAILLTPDQPPQELSGAEKETTNNRMELQAAIQALSALPEPHRITFVTDSKYLKQGINEWLLTWQANNWRTSGKNPVKNKDLWQNLAELITPHQIDWKWTKGHAGNKWNERADELASAQIPKSQLPLDDQDAIHLFTGAAYSGKQKQGSWATLLRFREHQKTRSGRVSNTSANRMHLQAAIEGLESLKQPWPVHLYTYSGYLKDGATQWIKGWKANNWQTKTGSNVSHRDLWEKLDRLNQTYTIHWHVVDKNNAPPELVQAKNLARQAQKS